MNISNLQKASLICFIVGKFQFVAAVMLAAANHPWTWGVFALYAILIAACVAFALIDSAMKRGTVNG